MAYTRDGRSGRVEDWVKRFEDHHEVDVYDDLEYVCCLISSGDDFDGIAVVAAVAVAVMNILTLLARVSRIGRDVSWTRLRDTTVLGAILGFCKLRYRLGGEPARCGFAEK